MSIQLSDLREALDWLDRHLDDKDKDYIRVHGIDNLHHGLGRFIRNEFGLWSGGPLKDYFVNLGINHGDDMSGIILKAYCLRLRSTEFDLTSEVEYYQNYWKNYDKIKSLTEIKYKVVKDEEGFTRIEWDV